MTAPNDNQVPLTCQACSKLFLATMAQLEDEAFACPYCGDREETTQWRLGLKEADAMLGALRKYREN